MEELVRLSALALAKAVKDKKISSSELLEYFIERYERFNPEINAIVATNFDQARKRAADADEALARGEIFGPLHGLPVGIQIVGPYLEDLTPIQFAINLEKDIIGPYQIPPGFDK